MFYRKGDQYLRGPDRDAEEVVSFNTEKDIDAVNGEFPQIPVKKAMD